MWERTTAGRTTGIPTKQRVRISPSLCRQSSTTEVTRRSIMCTLATRPSPAPRRPTSPQVPTNPSPAPPQGRSNRESAPPAKLPQEEQQQPGEESNTHEEGDPGHRQLWQRHALTGQPAVQERAGPADMQRVRCPGPRLGGPCRMYPAEPGGGLCPVLAWPPGLGGRL